MDTYCLVYMEVVQLVKAVLDSTKDTYILFGVDGGYTTGEICIE